MLPHLSKAPPAPGFRRMQIVEAGGPELLVSGPKDFGMSCGQNSLNWIVS